MSADDNPATKARPSAVLDPQWEVALRSGQAAEGEQGSVEDELAVLQLLRHARAPQPLRDGALDRLWDDVAAASRPAVGGWRAWLQKPWLLGSAAAAAAAVLLVVVVSDPGPSPSPDDGGRVAVRDPVPAVDHGAMAASIEAQFAMLEPGARAEVSRSIDEGRSSLRGELLAAAIASDGRTLGGAP
jgi:hypothetical protein